MDIPAANSIVTDVTLDTVQDTTCAYMKRLVKTIKPKINLYLNKKKKKMESKPLPPNGFIKTCLKYIIRTITLMIHGVLCLVYGKSGEAMPPITDLILLESASSLAYKIRTKKLSSVKVCQSFIARIGEVNPTLNCVVDERFEEALREAAEADKLIESGEMDEKMLADKKPFLGVPISTKDCIAVKGMLHTSGLWKRRDIHAEEDADAISLMREAGAIPFALTNVSELCMWWESSNTVHGRTNNPYDTTRIVGGSSGGEGCLQASAGSPFGIGSDIGGSIRMPAFFNGVYGHKPSRFIVSIKGQYPQPFSKDVSSFLGIGPICRFAGDLLPVLKIISGSNAAKLNLDEPVDLRSLKFYYQESDLGFYLTSPVDPDITKCIHDLVNHLKRVHDVKPEKVQINKLQKSAAIWLANMKSKTAPRFSQQLSNLEGSLNPWWELVKWIFRQSNHTFIGLVTAIMETLGVEIDSPKHKHLVEQRKLLELEFNDMLGTDGVFIYPTHPTPAPYHNEPIVNPLNFSYTAIINCLGLPATACPMGLSRNGLPIGIQVVGGLNQDRLCLAVAREIERGFGGWITPDIKV